MLIFDKKKNTEVIDNKKKPINLYIYNIKK